MSRDFMTARDWIAHMRSILDGKAEAPPGQQALGVNDEAPPEGGAEPWSEQVRRS